LKKNTTASRSSAGNRETILAAATALFAQSGCAAVSIRDIAKASAVNIPTIYHYFGDKDGLYQECCSLIFRSANQQLRASINPGASAEENVIAFVAELYAMVSSETHLAKLFLRELADGDEAGLAKLTDESFFTAFDALDNALKQLITEQPDKMQIISIFALTFGLAQMSHMRPVLRETGEGMLDSPSLAAKFVLATMLPALTQSS